MPWDLVQRGPLLTLQAPVLFVTGDADDMCNLSHLKRVCNDMQSSDIRFVVMKVRIPTWLNTIARTGSVLPPVAASKLA